MKLGPLTLEHPFVLAPMAGITSSPFRILMRRRRASLVVSELVSANGIHYGGDKTLDLLRFAEEERPVGLQLFGEEPARLAEAARVVERMGADFVDLNMGCPVPKVVKKGGGAAMCKDLVTASKILTAMVKAVKIPVSIKIRSGWDETTKNAVEMARMAADAGVSFLAIHGRTRAEGYSGRADWDFIGTVKAKSSIPVVGNGDVLTAEIANERLQTYGVDAVMIGRGMLRNPFIFEQAEALWRGQEVSAASPQRYLELMNELNLLFVQGYPERVAMLQARKFLAWFSSGFPGASEFRRKVFTLPDSESLWAEARKFFETAGRGRDEAYLAEPFLMGGHG